MSTAKITQTASIAEFAETLNVSTKTVRRMISRGELRAFRVGNSRLIRIDVSQVSALLHPVRPRSAVTPRDSEDAKRRPPAGPPRSVRKPESTSPQRPTRRHCEAC